jgi:alkylation response protein AidB-like acyl-CoA dehydrogenase
MTTSIEVGVQAGVDGELAGRASSIAAMVADHAAKAETARRLTPETAQAILDAGFARHFVPARWGGAEGSFAEYVQGVAALARADASAGWCASLAAAVGRMAGFLPEAGQRALWSGGPDTLVVSGLIPAGSAIEVDGGWILEGSWPYVSEVHYADWALVCCPVPLGGATEVRMLLVPREAYGVHETWFTSGMRATGSETLVLEPTFVPVEHTFARQDMISGRAWGGAAHGAPFKSVSGLSFAAPILGAADGALDAWSAGAARCRAKPRDGNRLTPDMSATADLTLARSAAEVDAARLLVERAAQDADTGRVRDRLVAARAQRDHVAAADFVLEAVNRLLRTAGTGAQHESSPLQRFWRDVNAAAGHAAMQWEPAARGFASLALAPGGGG